MRPRIKAYHRSLSVEGNKVTITTLLPLQPFTQDCGLTSNTTHVVCVHFIREWRDLQINVDSEPQIFEKLFHVMSFGVDFKLGPTVYA